MNTTDTTTTPVTYFASEKHTTSKGRDTYGYNICTIRVHGSRYGTSQPLAVGRCNGGGYDMVGTSLAKALCAMPEAQARLQRVMTRENANSYHDGAKFVHHAKPTFYGVYLNKDGSVSIDGGVGLRSVTNAFKAAGITIEEVYNGRKRIGFYITFA
jgi:hypothetical protein